MTFTGCFEYLNTASNALILSTNTYGVVFRNALGLSHWPELAVVIILQPADVSVGKHTSTCVSIREYT